MAGASDLKVDVSDHATLIRVDSDSDLENSKKSKTKSSKPMNARQREGRITAYRKRIAEANTCIDALEKYTMTVCKEFTNGRIERVQLVSSIALIETAIADNRNRRDLIQSALDKFISS